jgi:hypothetical protein
MREVDEVVSEGHASRARVGKKAKKSTLLFADEKEKENRVDRSLWERSALPSWGGTRDFARCPCERSVPRKRKIRERVRVRRP